MRLRRYALKVFSARIEAPAFVLVAYADHEDLAAVDTERAKVLDDDALPVDARDPRNHTVADFQRVGRGCLSVGHVLEGITRDGEVPASDIDIGRASCRERA